MSPKSPEKSSTQASPPRPPKQLLRAHERFDAHHPTALSIYCSDGRFTGAVEELLSAMGHARLDTLTMPGGPALLDLSSALYSDVDTVTRAATFLIRSHHITEVVLLAHEGCGYYAQRYPTRTREQLLERQIADLRAAQRPVRLMSAHLKVKLFYAHLKEGAVVFEEIEPE